MYSLPPGTSGSWITYATINGWFSFYNDEWRTYVSTEMNIVALVNIFVDFLIITSFASHKVTAKMHEIGHNLGLDPSGEATPGGANEVYADQSGIWASPLPKTTAQRCASTVPSLGNSAGKKTRMQL